GLRGTTIAGPITEASPFAGLRGILQKDDDFVGIGEASHRGQVTWPKLLCGAAPAAQVDHLLLGRLKRGIYGRYLGGHNYFTVKRPASPGRILPSGLSKSTFSFRSPLAGSATGERNEIVPCTGMAVEPVSIESFTCWPALSRAAVLASMLATK